MYGTVTVCDVSAFMHVVRCTLRLVDSSRSTCNRVHPFVSATARLQFMYLKERSVTLHHSQTGPLTEAI